MPHILQVVVGPFFIRAQSLGNVSQLQGSAPLPQQIGHLGPEEFFGENLRQSLVVGRGVAHVHGVGGFPRAPQAYSQHPPHPVGMERIIEGLQLALGVGIPLDGPEAVHGL